MIYLEIDGKILHLAIRELFIKAMEDHAYMTNPDYTREIALRQRVATLEDPAYLKAEKDMLYFFVRNFPKAVVRTYDIISWMSILYGSRAELSPAERQGVEASIKRQVMLWVRLLHNDIKRMFKTRSSGRPRQVETGPVPEIVNTVVNLAKQLMGERRGRDAVPALKTIADQLGTSEDALGQRLRRKGYPWTTIRSDLENLT